MKVAASTTSFLIEGVEGARGQMRTMTFLHYVHHSP
jgi:hypothetical protein